MAAKNSAASASSTDAPTNKLYFGYGSNLWLDQMRQRCPSSHFIGIGRLGGFKWIINARGYANVVEASKADEVWGLVYFLTPVDEEGLDLNEGVPDAYTKEVHRIDFWTSELHNLKYEIDTELKPLKKDALVYIDRKRIEDGKPRPEYVVRMNHGIEDALKFGVPAEYVEKVMRTFIPSLEKVDEKTVERAKKQAVNFQDEDEDDWLKVRPSD